MVHGEQYCGHLYVIVKDVGSHVIRVLLTWFRSKVEVKTTSSSLFCWCYKKSGLKCKLNLGLLV